MSCNLYLPEGKGKQIKKINRRGRRAEHIVQIKTANTDPCTLTLAFAMINIQLYNYNNYVQKNYEI